MDDSKEIIRKNIIKLREERNYTKKYVAQSIGVLPNTYRVWEAEGKSGIRSSRLIQLAEFYGVSLDYLFTDHENELTVAATDEYNKKTEVTLTDDEQTLLSRFRSLSDEEKEKLLNELK